MCLQNANLTQYYLGYSIQRKQNQSTYTINGLVTTYISVQQCKDYIDQFLLTKQKKS